MKCGGAASTVTLPWRGRVAPKARGGVSARKRGEQKSLPRLIERPLALQQLEERALELAHFLLAESAAGGRRTGIGLPGTARQRTRKTKPWPGRVLLRSADILNSAVGLIVCAPRNRYRVLLFLMVFRNWRGNLALAAPDCGDEARALIAQNALHTADRVTLPVEKLLDAAQQLDIVGTIVAPAAAALHRADLREARFPEAQHMLRQFEIAGDLADSAKSFRSLGHASTRIPPPPRKMLSVQDPPTSASLSRCFNTLLGLKINTLRGEMGTSCPVFGLRPMRWPLLRT